MALAPFASRQRGGGQLAAVPGYRWAPRRDIDDINSRLGQLMQTFYGDPSALTGAGGWSPLAPPVDVEETDDAYVVDIDLPNVDPSEVTIEMRGEELRVAGEFREQGRGGIIRRRNRRAGEFEYLIDLPSDIDSDRVEATYGNGALTVTVGKARDNQPRRIEIREQQDQRTKQADQRNAQGERNAQAEQRSAQQAGKRD
jgi:HSP20 family protein